MNITRYPIRYFLLKMFLFQNINLAISRVLTSSRFSGLDVGMVRCLCCRDIPVGGQHEVLHWDSFLLNTWAVTNTLVICCIYGDYSTLRIQVCPKKGISPTILFWRWDWDHQSYFRERSGFLGLHILPSYIGIIKSHYCIRILMDQSV